MEPAAARTRARRLSALALVLFFALPARAGWTVLPAPPIPEGTPLRDFRGMETHRLIADDSGALYLYLGDTLYRGREGGAAWSALAACPYGDESPVFRPLLLNQEDWILCNRMFSTDRGRAWRDEPPNLYGMLWLTFIPGKRFLGSMYYGNSLYLSEDTGSHFSAVGGMRLWYEEFADAGKGHYLVAGRDGEMLYSADAGYTWNTLFRPSGDSVAEVRAFALAADPHPGEGTVYALSGSGNGTGLHVIRWREGGIHVATLPSLPGFPDSAVTCFRASPIAGGTRLWAGTWGQGLFASDDGGRSWFRADAGSGDPHVAGLAVAGEDVFLLTQGGLYRETASVGLRREARSRNPGMMRREIGPAVWIRGQGQDGARFRIDGKRAPAPIGR